MSFGFDIILSVWILLSVFLFRDIAIRGNDPPRAASRERPVLLPVSLDVRSGLSRRMALGETKHTVNVSRIALSK